MSAFLKSVIALIFICFAATTARADPSWTASGVQTCNETFAGSDLNASWQATPGPTVAPYMGNSVIDVSGSMNYRMLHPGLDLFPLHKNFRATSTYTFPYTTTQVTSRPGNVGCGYQVYGWFEATFAMPPAATAGGALGTWPSWWMMPTNGSSTYEIDFMERFNGNWGQSTDPNHFWTTLHYAAYANTAYLCQSAFDARSWVDKHTLAMDWEPTTMQVYMDGVLCTGPSNPTGLFVAGGYFVNGVDQTGSLTNLNQGTVTAGSGGTAGTYALGISGGTGCAGTGAGTYTIAGGVITKINLTNVDSGCTVVPTLSFPSGSITGAAATLRLMGGIPSIPGFHILVAQLYNNMNQAQATAIDQGNASYKIYNINIWQKNANLPQIQLPMHINQITFDKPFYNPGETATITINVTAGTSALTGIVASGFVYDVCGDSPGFSPCMQPPTNNTFGAQILWNAGGGISLSAGQSGSLTATWVVPVGTLPGVYTLAPAMHDTGSAHTENTYVHFNIGPPN